MNGLDRIHQAARKDKNLKITSLMHHISVDLLRASFITRSIKVHRNMKYHAIDEDHNYSAETIERLVLIMLKDGALFEDSADIGFSVTILNNRTVVGTGILIIDNI